MGAVGSLLALSTGCSSPPGGPPKAATVQPRSPSASTAGSTSSGVRSPVPAPDTSLPRDVERVARAFTTAYAEHDARDGKDDSYADAGARAARLATGELVDVLAQQRPSQYAPWAALRDAKARQTVEIISTVVPDGAPAVTKSSALVRVGYSLTTTPQSGPARRSSEQLALRLEHTSNGWRVTAMPWT
ncbi:hypothetical protein ACWC9Q_10595 [Streptomyces sp. NPDC001142]